MEISCSDLEVCCQGVNHVEKESGLLDPVITDHSSCCCLQSKLKLMISTLLFQLKLRLMYVKQQGRDVIVVMKCFSTTNCQFSASSELF